MRKVILIGIDAGCLPVILPWVERGKLPNLEHLLEEGCYAPLKSIIPDVTPPAWTSLVTGRNPGKHGITCEFFKQSDNVDQKGIVSSLDNKSGYIWDYLSENGMTSIVINVPVTHPARKMKGVIIPGYLAPPEPVCYPYGALEELRSHIGPYEIYGDSEVHETSPETTLREFMDLTTMRKEAALYFASQYDWDFLMIEFQKTDGIFHVLPRDDQHDLRLQLYQCVDNCIGEIIGTVGKGANIILASDHGIGPCKWSCCIDSWLCDKGWLRYKTMDSGQVETLYSHKKGIISKKGNGSQYVKKSLAERIYTVLNPLIMLLGKAGITVEVMEKFLNVLHLGFLGKKIPKSIRNQLPRKQIDWSATKAYCPSPRGGIRINLKGRDASGIVNSQTEYDELREAIVNGLADLKTPEDRSVFTWVGYREEYYSGNEIDEAPDILFIPNDDSGVTFHSTGALFRKIGGFGHKMDGIIAAVGPDIRTNGQLPLGAGILDIAPTVLFLLGLPVPKDMDGRILTDLLKEDSELRSISPLYYDEIPIHKIRSKVHKIKKHRKV